MSKLLNCLCLSWQPGGRQRVNKSNCWAVTIIIPIIIIKNARRFSSTVNHCFFVSLIKLEIKKILGCLLVCVTVFTGARGPYPPPPIKDPTVLINIQLIYSFSFLNCTKRLVVPHALHSLFLSGVHFHAVSRFVFLFSHRFKIREEKKEKLNKKTENRNHEIIIIVI